MDRWLERALAAEDQLESANARVAELEARLRSALNAEPTSASRALSWITRAQEAERFLLAITADAKIMATLPPPLRTRIEAQLRTVEILRRDQARFGESPTDEEYWETWRDSNRRSWVRTTKDTPT